MERRSKSKQCSQCGKPLSYGAGTVCRDCWRANTVKEMPHCLDCGIELSTRRSTRCLVCMRRYRAEHAAEHRCIECGAPVEHRAILCLACHTKKVSREAKHCTDCGVQLQSRRTTQCRECFRKSHMVLGELPSCKKCGVRLRSHKAKLCRVCWRAERSDNRPSCSVCGKPLALYHGGSVCRACLLQQSDESWPHCLDCGKKLSHRGATRCGPCYRKRQHEIALAGGNRNLFNSQSVRRLLKGVPCMVCGVVKAHESLYEIHKVDPPKGYVRGNVLKACLDCHKLHHRHLLAMPDTSIMETHWDVAMRHEDQR